MPDPGVGFSPTYDSNGEITGYVPSTGYPYGGGGGYGMSAPTENDEKAAKILAAIINANADTLKNMYDGQMAVYQVADDMSRYLADRRICQAKRKAGQEWYFEQQKLQSAASNLADVAANAMNSSLYYDYREMVSRVDDQGDTEVLKTMRESIQDIKVNLAEALMATINSRNDLSANTEQQLRQMLTDWASQINNIHPDLLRDRAELGGTLIDYTANVPAAVSEPDWLNYDTWFEDHDRIAIKPEDVPVTRPDATAQKAWDNGRIKEVDEYEGASDPWYWNAIQDDSERKTQ